MGVRSMPGGRQAAGSRQQAPGLAVPVPATETVPPPHAGWRTTKCLGLPTPMPPLSWATACTSGSARTTHSSGVLLPRGQCKKWRPGGLPCWSAMPSGRAKGSRSSRSESSCRPSGSSRKRTGSSWAASAGGSSTPPPRLPPPIAPLPLPAPTRRTHVPLMATAPPPLLTSPTSTPLMRAPPIPAAVLRATAMVLPPCTLLLTMGSVVLQVQCTFSPLSL